ncbi:MAG: glycosyltransferase [Planctomycetes bacterium]|nr:glycosyltransferase [Planctomycetota bacterium]
MENSSTIQHVAEGGLRLRGVYKKNSGDNALVTIITATLNRKDYLEEAIQSVISQTYENIEYIIVDGGSTDGTLDIIKKYDDKIDYWISRPDNSMYEAINSGVKHSRGDIIAVLNSDDKYAGTDVIEQVINHLQGNPGIDGIYGNLVRLYESHTRYKRLFQVNYRQYLISGKGTFVPHSTLFVKRQLIEKVGLYDTRYRYASDYDFILRCLKNGTLKYINYPLTFFRVHDKSITSTDGTITPETFIILKKHEIDRINKIYRRLMYIYLWGKYKLLSCFTGRY